MRNVSGGSAAATVVLVGLDGESMGMVRETLAAEAVLPNVSVNFQEAPGVIDRTRPDVVIVSYTGEQDTALELAETLVRSHPRTVLVALAQVSDAQGILAAMRVGYKEFVVLPTDAQRLRQVVHEAAYAVDDDDEKGQVLAFIGAKGGVGNTLLASHLCAELAAIHRCLVIDLDFGMGDLANLLDVSPTDNIADVLQRADRIDERSLTSAVVVHRSKMHVLATPTDLDSIAEVNADDIYSIISTAAKAYQFVILDCGIYLDEAVAMGVNVADTVVVTTTTNVTAVRDCFRRLRLLERIGVEKERTKLVVNRYREGSFVSLEDITENLGVPVAATVSEDVRTVAQAVNEGKLVRDVNKKSDAARDISTLVAVLTEDAEGLAEEETKSSGGFFSSLFRRG